MAYQKNIPARALDHIDLRILHLLQSDAKLTHKEIAAQLKLTTTPVFERVKRLEKSGYIQKYMAILDRKLLGLDLVAFCSVSLKEHAQHLIEQFEREIMALEEVVECFHITGQHDYLLRVVTTDMQSYQQFIVGRLAKLGNIGQVQSSFIMTEVKNQPGLPFEQGKRPG